MGGRRVALIVDVDPDAPIEARWTANLRPELRALVDILRDVALGGFDVEVVRNETSSIIETLVERFLLRCGPNDVALLFVVGPAIRGDTGEYYLKTRDTRIELLAVSALPVEQITSMMAGSRARSIALFLDFSSTSALTVRSPAGHRSPRVGAFNPLSTPGSDDARARAVVVMPPKSPDYRMEEASVALTREEYGRSDFVDAIVQGIRTGSADRDLDGQVSLRDLIDYVHDRLRETSRGPVPNTMQRGKAESLMVARTPPRADAAQPPVASPPLRTGSSDRSSWPRDRLQEIDPGTDSRSTRTCDRCGSVNSTGQTFCGFCGGLFDEGQAPTPDWPRVEEAPSARGTTPLVPPSASPQRTPVQPPPSAVAQPPQRVMSANAESRVARRRSGSRRRGDVTCPQCGEGNPLSRRFCRRCGESIVISTAPGGPVTDDRTRARGPWRGSPFGSARHREGAAVREPTLQARIDAAVDAIVREGQMVFNPPESMRQGRVERVEVAIARTKGSDEKLSSRFRGRGEPQFEDVETSPIMAVELKGRAFEITPLHSSTKQLLRPTAHWEFDVLPRRVGQQRLQVCVAMMIEVSNRPDEWASIPVLERDIRVAVDPRYTIQYFVRQNWQWSLATLAGLGGAIAAWLKLINGG